MILDVTRLDKILERKINEEVGKSFSFIQRIKIGGIGSGRQVIIEATEEITNLLSKENSIKYSNIELRTKGIIIGFKSYAKTYYLLIPYAKLTVFKSNKYYKFYGNKHHIKMQTNPTLKTFYKKLIAQKAAYINLTSPESQ